MPWAAAVATGSLGSLGRSAAGVQRASQSATKQLGGDLRTLLGRVAGGSPVAAAAGSAAAAAWRRCLAAATVAAPF